ncbi:MAG: TetR/AcrR family transcriptional regulator [Anaerolineales bacterium]|nr:TetR/AcrR family transcriptional regulator [Anaerolineales bacterium]
MDNLPQNETREKIMDTAERLFMTRGYKSVRLRDIAEAVGMRHASLYYYVPKGKEQLFVAVVRRSMERHQHEITRLIGEAEEDIQAQAYAVSDWLVSQPPLDLARMFEVDLREIDEGVAAELEGVIFHSLTAPLMGVLEQAQAAGTVRVESVGMAAMALLTLVQSARQVPLESIPEGRQAFGRKLVDMLLKGWLAREV